MSRETTLDKIVSLAKRRGFVFPGSEIYGGFAGTYDWGPLGVELRRNVVDTWLRAMKCHDNIAQLDSSIFTAPRVWEASGHVSGFNDPLVVCLSCHSKLRADHLLEAVGVVADEKMSEDEEVYLRAETAQGIFINYKNVLDSGFYSIPFGIAQVGKAFRNEISPRQFLFRKREFEQMEMQYFVHPKEALAAYEACRNERMIYYDKLGVKKHKLRWKQHENLVFYAKNAWDIQYEYPFGWNELEGVHYRGDYDLSQHQKFSGVDMTYYDEKTKERYVPHVVETSVGVDRTVLMLLADAYDEDEMNGETRFVLRFKPSIAPVKVAVFPLLKNKPELVNKAREVFTDLKKEIRPIMFDDNGNIGKRYRRQDEIGTPFCVTIDFDTLENDTVTVRDRDTGKQERVKVGDLASLFKNSLK